MNGPQDLGGQMGFGPVAPEADEPVFHADWERRALALTLAAGAMGHWSIDESRHARESLHPAVYYTSSYYAIWIKALAPGHWRLASAEAVEGAALAGLGRYSEAEKLLLGSYGVLHKDKGAAHVYVVNCSRWLVKLYLATGQPAKAARYRVRQHG